MSARTSLLLAALASACGPTVDVPATTDASSGDATSSGSGDTSDPDGSTTTAPGVDSGDTLGESTGTTPSLDPCTEFEPDACPEGCRVLSVASVTDAECSSEFAQMCVAVGPPHDGPPTTYFLPSPEGPRFITAGGSCGVDDTPGDGWTECAGLLDHPEDCACFCQAGFCPGAEEVAMLDACDWDMPCPTMMTDNGVGAFDPEIEQCVLEGLRDRTPGIYEITTVGGFSGQSVRMYVRGGEVDRVMLQSSDLILCPERADWQPAEHCQLAPPAYFTACLGPPTLECGLDVGSWAEDCSAPPPACLD